MLEGGRDRKPGGRTNYLWGSNLPKKLLVSLSRANLLNPRKEFWRSKLSEASVGAIGATNDDRKGNPRIERGRKEKIHAWKKCGRNLNKEQGDEKPVISIGFARLLGWLTLKKGEMWALERCYFSGLSRTQMIWNKKAQRNGIYKQTALRSSGDVG